MNKNIYVQALLAFVPISLTFYPFALGALSGRFNPPSFVIKNFAILIAVYILIVIILAIFSVVHMRFCDKAIHQAAPPNFDYCQQIY